MTGVHIWYTGINSVALSDSGRAILFLGVPKYIMILCKPIKMSATNLHIFF